MKKLAKWLLTRIVPINRLLEERNQLFVENENLKAAHGYQIPFVPNGHFYSPIPLIAELRRDEERIYAAPSSSLPGINLDPDKQVELLHVFAEYYKDLPFKEHRTEGQRYFFENSAYSYSDAIFLYCMIRHVRPKRIVEVGSGFSSGAMLDVNERFLENTIDCTFIDPYPQLLTSLLKSDDATRVTIIPRRVQDVELSTFERLEANDILFVDSTHVSKTGSDVNRILFEILPSLNKGVYVHFHDIFYPFEYPRDWVYEGRAWNENYLLRGFLQYNSAFEIVFFNTFLELFFEPYFAANLPLCLKNKGGSIWLRKR